MKNLVFPIALAALVCLFSAPAFAQHHDHEHGGHHMKADSAFASMITHYDAIHGALAGDTTKGISNHAKEIREIADATSKNFNAMMAGVSEENAKALKDLLPEVGRAASKLESAKDLSSAREAFGELSQPLVRYRKMLTGEDTKVAYCPMVKKPWLQTAEKIENPYYGSSMLRCGSFVSE